MNEPKILSQKTIFRADLFDIIETKLLLSDKSKRTHHNIRERNMVVVFPLTDDYELYLVSQYRYLLQKQVLEGVAGFIEDGETSVHAAQRELSEETGFKATQLEEIARINTASSVIHATTHLFLAKGLEEGEKHPEAGEEISIRKLSLADAVQKVLQGEIHTAATVDGILLLDILHREKKL